MSLFRHPHITRGVVHTAQGAFVVSRGIVEAPDDVGESAGWTPLADDDDAAVEAQKFSTRQPAPASAPAAPRTGAY
jgi:hypothetical protein